MELDAKDPEGRTALHLAASDGFEDVIELLCTAGANVNCLDDGMILSQ